MYSKLLLDLSSTLGVGFFRGEHLLNDVQCRDVLRRGVRPRNERCPIAVAASPHGMLMWKGVAQSRGDVWKGVAYRGDVFFCASGGNISKGLRPPPLVKDT